MPPRLVLVLTENWAASCGVPPRELLAHVARWSRQAEDAGFDAVMIGEHAEFGLGPGHVAAPRAAARFTARAEPADRPSPLAQLAAAGACTRRVRLVAGGAVSARRHPLLLAKDFATLDRLTGGRLVVRPTIAHPDAADGTWDEREDLLEEYLDIWRETWTACAAGRPVTHRGARHRFEAVTVAPGPVHPCGPPTWLGDAVLSPRQIRTLVRHGAGYHAPAPPTPAELVHLADAMDAAGRPASSLELVTTLGSPGRDRAGAATLDCALGALVPLLDQGFGTVCVRPSDFVDDPDRSGGFCQEVAAGVRAVSRRTPRATAW